MKGKIRYISILIVFIGGTIILYILRINPFLERSKSDKLIEADLRRRRQIRGSRNREVLISNYYSEREREGVSVEVGGLEGLGREGGGGNPEDTDPGVDLTDTPDIRKCSFIVLRILGSHTIG